jgi:ketosteroid isomerase-like protein
MSYQAKATEIYTMLGQGQLLDAFDKHYHDDVVMIEADGKKREGKAVSRAYEQNFLGMIKEFHNLSIGSITADEANGITTVESVMDVTFQDGNRVALKQVAIQRWKGEHIVEERFYQGSN